MSQTVASALNNKVVTFVSGIDSIFNCVICLQVADEPVRCSGMCAGVFCNGCMQQALTRRSNCPTCDIETSNVPRRDVVLRNQIMNNQVFCFNDGTDILTTRSTRKRKAAADDKCTWTGKYDQLAAHLNQCDYGIVKCNNNGCTAKVVRCKLMEHSQVCVHRMANCGHCNVDVKAALMLNHLHHCLKVDIACECGFECQRDALPTHRDKDCPMIEIRCDVIGCDAKMKRGDYEKHQEQAASQHVRLLSAALGQGIQENARLALEVGIMKQDVERLSAMLKNVVYQQFKWRLPNVTNLLKLAASDEKCFESPRFDIGNHKIFIKVFIQEKRLGLYICKDVAMSVDKTSVDLNGSSFTVAKAGLPDVKRFFVLGNFLEPPEWRGRGFRSVLADMTPYIDDDSLDITADFKFR